VELDTLTYQPFLLTTSRPPARGSQSSVGKGAAVLYLLVWSWIH
jgi:hypothetical protein